MYILYIILYNIVYEYVTDLKPKGFMQFNKKKLIKFIKKKRRRKKRSSEKK